MSQVNAVIPPAIDAILQELERNAEDSKQKLLMTYGHAWTKNFLDVLLGIVGPVQTIAEESRIAPTLNLPNYAPLLGPIWNFDDSRQRLERVRESLRDYKRFRNPPIADLETTLLSGNALLDAASRFDISQDETSKLYNGILSNSFASAISITPDFVKQRVMMQAALVATGDLCVYLSCHYNVAKYLDEAIDYSYDERLAVITKRKEIDLLLTRCMAN